MAWQRSGSTTAPRAGRRPGACRRGSLFPPWQRRDPASSANAEWMDGWLGGPCASSPAAGTGTYHVTCPHAMLHPWLLMRGLAWPAIPSSPQCHNVTALPFQPASRNRSRHRCRSRACARGGGHCMHSMERACRRRRSDAWKMWRVAPHAAGRASTRAATGMARARAPPPHRCLRCSEHACIQASLPPLRCRALAAAPSSSGMQPSSRKPSNPCMKRSKASTECAPALALWPLGGGGRGGRARACARIGCRAFSHTPAHSLFIRPHGGSPRAWPENLPLAPAPCSLSRHMPRLSDAILQSDEFRMLSCKVKRRARRAGRSSTLRRRRHRRAAGCPPLPAPAARADHAAHRRCPGAGA